MLYCSLLFRCRLLIVVLLCCGTMGLLFAGTQLVTVSRVGTIKLSVEGSPCCLLSSVEGGARSAEIVETTTTNSPFPTKYIGRISCSPIVMQTDFGFTSTLSQWIASFLSKSPVRKNGAVTYFDATTPISKVQFTNGQISGITVPGCDRNSESEGLLTVTVQPAVTLDASPAQIQNGTNWTNPHKRWLSNNFRLAIDGIDCSGVVKIDAFTISQAMTQYTAQSLRGEPATAYQPGKLTFPNLQITLTEDSAQPWKDWLTAMFHNGQVVNNKKDGHLSLLARDGTTELLRINFHNLGICGMGKPHMVPNGGTDTVLAELFCESMDFNPTGTPGADTKR